MELLVVFYVLATLAVAYLWLYPRFIGNNLRLMTWVDAVVTAIPVGISALLFWQSDPTFRLIFIDLNWFVYTVLITVLIELPVFLLYLRARGLSREYWKLFKRQTSLGISTKHGAWAAVSAEDVAKNLDDEKWNGLRTVAARRGLLWSSNFFILGGTGILIFVGDNPLSSYALIHVLLIFVFWFLLRKSVRLVADAPDDALDEMHLRRRDRAHVLAFRILAAAAVFAASVLMTYALVIDSQSDSDGFRYLVEVTWPQVQAIFWLAFAYGTMLPSMAMLAIDLKRERAR